MGLGRRQSGRGHAVGAAVALLALFLQLLFPAGFMAAAPGQAHGLPIVICTAQGQTTVEWDLGAGHKPKAPAKSMAPCAFAGHATASAPPLPIAVAASPEAWIAAAAALPETVAPGRGLAAPPPPAIGPPIRL